MSTLFPKSDSSGAVPDTAADRPTEPTEKNALSAFGSESAPVRRAAAGQGSHAVLASEAASGDAPATPSSPPANLPPRVPWWRHRSVSIGPLWLAVAAVGGAAAGIAYAHFYLPAGTPRHVPPPTVTTSPSRQSATPAPVSPPVDRAPAEPPPQAAAPAPVPAPAPLATDPTLAQERERRRHQREIHALIEAYRQAYERLDPSAVAGLWPDVDVRALERTFSTLSQQQLTFDRCEITISGATAVARCAGSLGFTRTDESEPQSRQMAWVFAFERATDQWRITGVNVR